MGACTSARACVPSANVKHDRACNAQQVLAICNKSSIEAEAINNAAILVILAINNQRGSYCQCHQYAAILVIRNSQHQ